jgi:hypothetical protein
MRGVKARTVLVRSAVDTNIPSNSEHQLVATEILPKDPMAGKPQNVQTATLRMPALGLSPGAQCFLYPNK